MSRFQYFPIIKTRDSELRCFKNLTQKQWEKILPIYELTKSRKTKLAPDGDISKRMDEINKIQGGRPFILDLTTDERYINPQIENLFNEEEGFLEWQYFLFDIYSAMNIIPMIHLYAEDDYEEVKRFVRAASSRSKTKTLAIRLPYDLNESVLSQCLIELTSALKSDCKIYVILDVGFFREDLDVIQDEVSSFCNVLDTFNPWIEDIILASTCFPKNPVKVGKSEECGEFDVYEEALYSKVLKQFPAIKYGDYVSINTEQVEIRATTFVPRIDLLSEDGTKFRYHRYRRADGGYVKCAQKVVSDVIYANLNTWADDQIKLASEGNPNGISPSFWISVRMNYYIARKLKLRSKLMGQDLLF